MLYQRSLDRAPWLDEFNKNISLFNTPSKFGHVFIFVPTCTQTHDFDNHPKIVIKKKSGRR